MKHCGFIQLVFLSFPILWILFLPSCCCCVVPHWYHVPNPKTQAILHMFKYFVVIVCRSTACAVGAAFTLLLLLLLLLLLIPVASCIHLRFIVVCFWPSCVGPPSLIVRVPITGEHEWGTHVLCQKIYNSTRCTYIFAFPTLQPFL